MLRNLRSVLIGVVGLIFPFVSGNSAAASPGEPPDGVRGAASPNVPNGNELPDAAFPSLGPTLLSQPIGGVVRTASAGGMAASKSRAVLVDDKQEPKKKKKGKKKEEFPKKEGG